MKKLHILLFLFLLKLINANSFLNPNKGSYHKALRKLWEEDMVIPPGRGNGEEADSLELCASSNYKYFSFVLSGANVTFGHVVSRDAAVSYYIIIYINFKYLGAIDN